MSEAEFTAEQYIKNLERSNKMSEPAVRQAIKALGVEKGCGLDIPCGIGDHASLLAEYYPQLQIEAADYALEHVEYAKSLGISKGLENRINFVTMDMNALQYEQNRFDFIWCCNGLWPGPVEIGCIAEEPYAILESFRKIVKPGGTIALLFWSSQKLLPGYPLLEATLNTCSSANIPMSEGKSPELHFMSAPTWLRKTGLLNIQSRTFTADICSPLDSFYKEAIHGLFDMFWNSAEKEVSAQIWEQYQSITDPENKDYILANPDYAGFITYTMFTADLPK